MSNVQLDPCCSSFHRFYFPSLNTVVERIENVPGLLVCMIIAAYFSYCNFIANISASSATYSSQRTPLRFQLILHLKFRNDSRRMSQTYLPKNFSIISIRAIIFQERFLKYVSRDPRGWQFSSQNQEIFVPSSSTSMFFQPYLHAEFSTEYGYHRTAPPVFEIDAMITKHMLFFYDVARSVHQVLVLVKRFITL